MNNHTPGPWFYDGPNQQDARVVHVAEGEIAQVFDEWCSQEEAEANARLIVAAPTLLAELALIVAGWTDIEAGKVAGRILTPWEKERLRFACEALAFAKG
jgi:hypothetical protein